MTGATKPAGRLLMEAGGRRYLGQARDSARAAIASVLLARQALPITIEVVRARQQLEHAVRNLERAIAIAEADR